MLEQLLEIKTFCHVSRLLQNLNFLKLNDVYKFELAEFMNKLYDNYNVPMVFQS